MNRLRWTLVGCPVAVGWLTMTLAAVPAVAQEKASGDKPITITADHLEVNRKLRTAVYTGNVTADDKNRCMVIMSDKMEFFFDEAMEQIERGLASGNVRITAGERRITSEQLELFPADDRAVLTGDPRVWQDNDLLTGTKITLFLKEDRAVVEGGAGKRVTAILYPRTGGGETSESDAGERKAKPATKKNGC
jgi:lipopolysaccharide export system protein LptA